MEIEKLSPSISSSFLSYKEAKKLYSSQRKIALKRMKRIEESGLDVDFYKRYQMELKPIAEFKTEQQLRKALYAAARYNELKTSTLTGLKSAAKKYAESMRERGYDVKNKDAAALGAFIGKVKKYYRNEKQFDSERVINYFLEHKTKEATVEEVDRVFKIWESGERFDERQKQRAERRKDSQSLRHRERGQRRERTRRERRRRR